MDTIRPPRGATKQRKRLGRGNGSGLGTTAGRGTKGQNSRSGGGVRPGFEGGQMPLYRRIARRGFSNYPFKTEHIPINLGEIESRYKSGQTVDLESLRGLGMIGKNDKLVKILGVGDIQKKVDVVGLKVSTSAREKILAAGGSVDGGSPSDAAETAALTKKARRKAKTAANTVAADEENNADKSDE